MKKLFFTVAIVATALCSNAQWETGNDVGSNRILYHNWDGGVPEAIIRAYENTNTAYARLRLGRSSGTTETPSNLIEAGDVLAQIIFQGYHTYWANAAAITAISDGTVSGSSMPGRLDFSTTPTLSTTSLLRMTIKQSGYIGIGTETPREILDVNGKAIIGSDEITSGAHTDYQLAVDGKIVCTEAVVTTTGWADFVFDDDYKLKQLEEVEDFVNKNNHLPDVPSEKEVLEDGISLGAMDAILLQKIEELTLYIIEQEKRIATLESQKAN